MEPYTFNAMTVNWLFTSAVERAKDLGEEHENLILAVFGHF